ncbi:MAG: HlyD family efflux transporter periplasmic adaptor subunit [Planctomycetes bacterium]|nr:HlyD family efflux transporter periplasmic adaptor subunit [Planctomycetota bacterium]
MPEVGAATPVDRVLPQPGLLLTRGILYLVLLALATFGGWAAYAKVDVIVSAEGRLVPERGAVGLSMAQPGLLVEVYVEVGARVKAGEPLLRIDAFQEEADVARLRRELEAARLQESTYRDSAAALRRALVEDQRDFDLQASVLVSLKSDLEDAKRLATSGVLSAQELRRQERDVVGVEARMAGLRANLRRSELDAERDSRLADIQAATVATREADLARAQTVRQRTVLTSPKDGTIASIAYTRPGRYLGPSEPAVTLLPDGEPLGAEIRIPNASMRRVREGLPVRLRMAAFPAEEYGVLSGEITRIEPDVDQVGSYRARVHLTDLVLHGPRGTEAMRPGLQAAAEILVDRRTVLEVLLDPYRKLKGGWTISE